MKSKRFERVFVSTLGIAITVALLVNAVNADDSKLDSADPYANSSGSGHNVKDTKCQNYGKLTRLPLGSITAEGWLKTQLERSKAGMGGHLDELEPEMIGKPYVTRDHKSKVSPGWTGEISGMYWAGLIQLAFTLDDEALKAKAEKWVRGTLSLQEEDGYLGSYRKTDNRLEDYCPWASHCCYYALLAWYDATGDEAVLDSVHRGLLWFVKNWSGDQKTPYASHALIESMMEVYLKTGDKRLYDWCLEYMIWLDSHDQYGYSMKNLQRPSLNYNQAHVVGVGQLVKHPALLYLANGKSEYLAATRNGIKQVMDKCWQCTGAPASNFEYLSPPSAHHETEYCNFTTYASTFSWMARITGEAKYGDLMERIFFNGAQGARKKDERAIAYMSSPNQFYATMKSSYLGGGGLIKEVYAPNFSTACCPVQSVRTAPEYIRSMVLRDKNENLFLAAYGPCALQFVTKDKNTVQISEETLYPFDETVILRVKASASWKQAIMLKVPTWCQSYQVTLNDEKLEPKADENGYVKVDHSWKDDTLIITFKMTPHVVPVTDVYFQKEPLRSVECGPLLFALKYKVKWTPISGTPITPLPKGWSWFNAECKETPKIYSFPLSGLNTDLPVTVKRNSSEYPWEDSPLKLVVPMMRAQKYAYPIYKISSHRGHTLPFYGNPVVPDEDSEIEKVELVPFGCTNLRMACFPVCDDNLAKQKDAKQHEE